MSEKTVLVAYLVETQNQGIPDFQRTTVLPASEQELTLHIRSKTGEPEAEVVIVEPGEWRPPDFTTTNQDEIAGKFNLVMARVMEHLAGLGVKGLDYGNLTRTGTVLPNPVNGKIYLDQNDRRKIAAFLGQPMNDLFPIETHLDEVAHELNPGTCTQ